MTLKQAIDKVRTDPSNAAAWRLIQQELERLVQPLSRNAGLREQAVRSVSEKLVDRALSNDLDEIRSPQGYLRRALRWRVIDGARAVQRRQTAMERATARERERQATDTAAPEPVGPELLEALEQVHARALTMRDAQHRDALDQAWTQIRRLHTEPVTLAELVIAEEGLDPTDEAVIRMARQRAHKAHQRCREAMQAALDWLVRTRRMDPESGEDLRNAISGLKRCQPRSHPDVLPAEE